MRLAKAEFRLEESMFSLAHSRTLAPWTLKGMKAETCSKDQICGNTFIMAVVKCFVGLSFIALHIMSLLFLPSYGSASASSSWACLPSNVQSHFSVVPKWNPRMGYAVRGRLCVWVTQVSRERFSLRPTGAPPKLFPIRRQPRCAPVGNICWNLRKPVVDGASIGIWMPLGLTPLPSQT